jgi:Na+-transporting NADH:ubiquinone oxidoreductase subunit B
MKALRNMLDRQAKLFEKGGKLEKFHALYEANDTFLFTPGQVTNTASHVRDALDLKRMMITVVVALIPCIAMALYNTGYQTHWAISHGAAPLHNWQTAIFQALGFEFDPTSILACSVHGLLYWLPVLLVTFAVGGGIEALSAVLRGHEINEGFLVTGMLLPLTLPAGIPLWMVGLGVAFGVVFGKEVFGGTGMNFLNPALVARAFLFFAYPLQMSGDIWIPADFTGVDAITAATPLVAVHTDPDALSKLDWNAAFIGLDPGSMGETSVVACLIGAAVLILTGVGSWRTMLGVVLGTFAMATTFNAAGSATNPMFQVPFMWHVVMGGWAFGTVFMATDPVSSSFTNTGKLVYGFGIGLMLVLVRTVNPAYPEGMMLSILFMNMFAPLIDWFVIKANIKRRKARYAAV